MTRPTGRLEAMADANRLDVWRERDTGYLMPTLRDVERRADRHARDAALARVPGLVALVILVALVVLDAWWPWLTAGMLVGWTVARLDTALTPGRGRHR